MNDQLLSKDECTILKGIAILTVILSHTSGVLRLFDGIPVLGNGLVCTALCEAGMPLFLFISGYGLHMSYVKHGLKGYWKKKLISVLAPYMMVQAVIMLVYIIVHGNDQSFLYNASVLFGINASNSYDPTMWYIGYAFFWYLIFFIAYKLWHGTLISLFVIAAVSLAGFCYVPFYWGNNADYCIMTFFAGVLTAWLTASQKKETAGIVILTVSSLLLCILGYTLMIRFHRLSIFTENLGSLAAGTSFIILVKLLHNKYAFPVLTFIGSISFPLYLLEWKLIINNKLYDITGVNYLTYGICFALTLVLSFLFNKAYSYISKEISSQIRNKRSI